MSLGNLIINLTYLLFNIGVLSSKCGEIIDPENENPIQSGDYNIGKSETIPNEFPWQAYIRIVQKGNTLFCGGSIISSKHILTAAHCVEDMEM